MCPPSSPSSPCVSSSSRAFFHRTRRRFTRRGSPFTQDVEEEDFQEVAVIPAPRDASGPGEQGKAVVLPKNVSPDVQKLVDQGWQDNAFNQVRARISRLP